MKTDLTFNDITDANKRIRRRVKITPILRSKKLDSDVGHKIILKLENLQETGSFKIRGAFNKLLMLKEAAIRKGIVSWSSGNHAKAIAYASNKLGISSIIVMPSDAPQNKIDGTKQYGAEILFYDRSSEDREKIAEEVANQNNRILVPSYDDNAIISGQGTLGIELISQISKLGTHLDAIFVPTSGGGLLAGIGIALKKLSPETKVFAIEPQNFNDHNRSIKSEKREKNKSQSGSICDSLLAVSPGKITWNINKKILSGAYDVSDYEVLNAIKYAYLNLGLKIEPGGAVGLATLLSRKYKEHDHNVAIILTGGNIDKEIFDKAMQIK